MKNLALFSLILFFLLACSKDDETTNQESPIVFKGIVVINEVGNQMGTWGTEDGDWSNDSIWAAKEFTVLDFPDTVNLDGTFLKDTTGWNNGSGIQEQPHNGVDVFPNPIWDHQWLYFVSIGCVKFKAAIVDQDFNRLFTYVSKDSSGILKMDLSDTTKFLPGKLYRMYYSLSAKDSINYYKGHGDILICHEPVFQDCAKYVP
jgi:hypothetical protein